MKLFFNITRGKLVSKLLKLKEIRCFLKHSCHEETVKTLEYTRFRKKPQNADRRLLNHSQTFDFNAWYFQILSLKSFE